MHIWNISLISIYMMEYSFSKKVLGVMLDGPFTDGQFYITLFHCNLHYIVKVLSLILSNVILFLYVNVLPKSRGVSSPIHVNIHSFVYGYIIVVMLRGHTGIALIECDTMEIVLM